MKSCSNNAYFQDIIGRYAYPSHTNTELQIQCLRSKKMPNDTPDIRSR